MTSVRYFYSITLLVILLYFWGAFNPSHYSWGIHYFAFFPKAWSIAALILALSVFVPAVRRDALTRLAQFTKWVANLPTAGIFIGLLVIWMAMILLFPVKQHLLGDSEIILQLTPDLPSIEDVSANFRNQPLTYESLRLIQWASGGGAAVEPMTLYKIADGITGVMYLGLIFFFLRGLGELAALDLLLIGVLIFFRTGTQFFFGYVENYMFFYITLTAFILTGWLFLKDKVPAWVPVALLVLIPGFHIAGVIFLPCVFLLFFPYRKTHKKYFIGGTVAIFSAAIAGVLVLGPEWVLSRIGDGVKYDVLPLFAPPGGVPYGMFSLAHIVDWANANMHIAPFGLACVTAGFIFVPVKEYRGDPVFLFLAGTSLVGLGMTFVVIPGLGMARDWDMLSNFFIPLRFLMVYFVIIFLRDKEIRHAILAVAVVTIIHWFAWIGINSNEDRHLARAEMLTVPELSGTFPKLYYEHLGKTFFDRGDYPKAVKWYEQYLKIDSTHARILANLSDCYQELGDRENVFRMLELSVHAKSTNAGVYSNLAVEYVSRGDTIRAIDLLNEAVKLDPGMAIPRANLCFLNMHRGRYEEARQNAAEAIRLGMREPVLFKEAGYASYFLKDYPTAIRSLNEYLKSAPSDEKTRSLYRELEILLGDKNPLKIPEAKK